MSEDVKDEGFIHARVVDPVRREEERIERPILESSFGVVKSPPIAAMCVSLRGRSQPEVVAFPGMTAFVKSSGADIVVLLRFKGFTSKSSRISWNVELLAASTTRPSTLNAMLVYPGVVFGWYATRLLTSSCRNTSRVQPSDREHRKVSFAASDGTAPGSRALISCIEDKSNTEQLAPTHRMIIIRTYARRRSLQENQQESRP